MKKNLLLIALFSSCVLQSIPVLSKDEDKKGAVKMYVKGSKKLLTGNFKAAERHYTDALEVTPSYELFFKRGCARYEAGSKEEALSDFETVISISPSFAEGYNHRGIVRLELGDTAGAMMDHNRAIQLNPFYADGYYQRAYVKMQMGQYQEAIIDYDKAIELNPTTAHGYMYLNRGYAYYFSGKYHNAMQNIAAAQERMSDNPYVYKIKALTEIAMGRKKDACVSISDALGLGYASGYGDDLDKLAKKHCR